MKRLLIAIAMLCYVIGHGQEEVKTHIFGHSLINHVSSINPPHLTTTPYWLSQFAEAAGNTYQMSGQWGQLHQHRDLNVQPNWGITDVEGAWDGDTQSFSDVGFEGIIIMPSNFEQYQAPHLNYEGGFQYSPISATETVFDWCIQQKSDIKLYIYEHWPEMSSYAPGGIPPSTTEWNNYNNYLQGGYHDWFIAYHDSLTASYPNSCISMIPVGPIISDILLSTPYDQIPLEDIYEDPDPHGHPNLYFLAGMITYMALYEEQTPANFTSDQTFIHPIIANNYNALRDLIWQELRDFDYADGTSRVFCDEPVTTSTADLTVDASGITFHPNPCDQLLVIEGELSRFHLQIIDSLGQVHHTLDNTGTESTFDISSLPSGVYFIRIQDRTYAQLWIENLVKM